MHANISDLSPNFTQPNVIFHDPCRVVNKNGRGIGEGFNFINPSPKAKKVNFAWVFFCVPLEYIHINVSFFQY